MKPLLIAAALMLTPGVAMAQAAAATLPNTFDRPAAGQTAAPQPAAPSRSTTPANAASEQMLRDFITAVQTDAVDYAVFTPDLAAKMRTQLPTLTPVIKGYGTPQAVDFVRAEDQTDLYAITFANAATEWMVGIRDGKLAAVLFREAED